MRILILVYAFLLLSCSHIPFINTPSGSNEGRLLTQDQAIERAANISEVAYSMSFDLSATENDFHGLVEIHFNMADSSKPLRIDFQEGTIKSLKINNQDSKNYSFNGFYLEFAPQTLKNGTNVVTIDYSHPYDHNGVGLHRFKDPEDGQVYLYTNFEPFDAHRLFPCFDQPDLKAHYTLTVSAPADWAVITSVREKNIAVQGGKKIWSFPESPLISTYLISLHAGPYQMWKSNAGDIPLRLFARKAMAKYIIPKDWFDPTSAGLKFYGDYFAVKYPFKKYDQVVAPDFNAGAMENVAAVTFSESYVKRGKPTIEDREHLGSVILHEMAHMWFGDLVTMKWWNGLWLNESFATFMSALSLHEATPYKRSWESLYLEDKLWAYFEDQMHTTHPIEANVPDTDQAFANFDGITYGKGASALKQLSFFISPEKFRNGVRDYFKKFAYKNATLTDFLNSLQQNTNEDLTSWSKEWLETTGLNTLSAESDCSGHSFQKMTLTQGATEESFINGKPLLRHHRTTVGFYKLTGNSLKLRTKISLKYANPLTNIRANGACPDLIFPNVDDQDYVKVQLQKTDVDILKEHLKTVPNTFDRILFWQALWDLVRDQKLKARDYVEIILKNFEQEKDLKVLGIAANTVYGGKQKNASALSYLLKDPRYAELQSNVENLLWNKLKSAPSGSDLQKRLFDIYVGVVQTPSGLENLEKILKGSNLLHGFILDQDRRWDIIRQLNGLSVSGADKLLAQEKLHDTSNMGVLMAISSEVASPQASVKKAWVTRILHDKDMPFAQKRIAMRYLFPWYQEDLKISTADMFYSNLNDVVKNQEEEFQESYSTFLVPTTCTLESSVRLETYIHDHLNLPPVVSKNLRNALQEDQRCVKVRALGIN